MAKDKNIEIERKEQYKIDMVARKAKRLQKNKDNKSWKSSRSGCRGCGEDPYCYCGSGTPGVIDY